MPEVLDWLLEPENPSVRYHSLRMLVGRAESDTDVRTAKAAIMQSGLVPAILAEQNADGSWRSPERFYTDKYHGTVWNLIILADLAADGQDPRVRRAAEFVMSHSYDSESGGFSVSESARTHTGLPGGVIPCLTGNMVYALVKLGFLNDPRVQRAVQWIARYQTTSDGDSEPPKGYPYDRFEMCFGKHVCHMGAAKALKGLAAIPAAERSAEASVKLNELMEYFLKHRIHKKSHDVSKVARPGWQRFGFPMMYQTDILELLGIMAQLGIRDERLDDALEVIRKREGPDGKWLLMETMNGRFLFDIELKGAPSKWITMKALQVLNAYQDRVGSAP